MTVLILGGTGTFGSRIAEQLSESVGDTLMIASRRGTPSPFGRALALDINDDLAAAMKAHQVQIVINCVGPFQGQDYRVATAAIGAGAHYLDLADGRAFVRDIDVLDSEARARNCLVVAGASSVPTLPAAVADHMLLHEFKAIHRLDYAISTAAKAPMGLATARAVLSYAGERFKRLDNGLMRASTGWWPPRAVRFPGVGRRWVAPCDIPDHDLLPRRYPSLHALEFRAGIEMGVLQWGAGFLALLRRMRIIPSPACFAGPLFRMAQPINRLGSEKSGFVLEASGLDQDDKPIIRRFSITAQKGDGIYIPTIPAVVLAKGLLDDRIKARGAMPSVGLVTLGEYLDAFKGRAITARWDV